MTTITIPNLGSFPPDSGLILLDRCSDGLHQVGQNGVKTIATTGDGKVEFIAFEGQSLAYVKSALGYPAYYPVHPVALQKPVEAVLMDLDGTSVRSEEFWIWIIEMTTASLLDRPELELEAEDLPHVSGHSVSEHLAYCLRKYCPGKTLEQARQIYFEHTHHELAAIMQGRGRTEAFLPSPGLKGFLLSLKAAGIRIGLVTSGLYEKAYPEILSVFRTLELGEPKDFYDAIITAGFPLRPGEVGTLGELTPKPHPWLYAEACRVGLGISFEERNSVVGIDDSGAGVCASRLAGLPTIGFAGGNILQSGAKSLCNFYSRSFEEILDFLQ
jgi:beta-phosphoglucomutase-like phosphatase (HAD superfamily)